MEFSDVSATTFDDAIAKERTPLSTAQEDRRNSGRILEQLLSAAQWIEDALSSRRSDVSNDRLPQKDGVAIQEIEVLVSDKRDCDCGDWDQGAFGLRSWQNEERCSLVSFQVDDDLVPPTLPASWPQSLAPRSGLESVIDGQHMSVPKQHEAVQDSDSGRGRREKHAFNP